MRVTKIEHTIGKNTMLVARNKFTNSRLPTTVGGPSGSSGTWVFGVQVRFTLDVDVTIGASMPRRLNPKKTDINDHLYVARSSWHYTDKAGFKPTREIPNASKTLIKARANYQAKAISNKRDDAPDPGNVYIDGKTISIFDGPGKLMPMATTTNPLTTYHIFLIELKSGVATLGKVKFHFFIEKEGGIYKTEAAILP